MSSVPLAPPFTRLFGDRESPWLMLLVGFLAMYLPVYWQASQGIWQSEEQGHGAIILAVLAWLFWSLRQPLVDAASHPMPVLGSMVFVIGLGVYAMGRVFEVPLVEFGSQPIVLVGALLLLKGLPAIRSLWFPLIFFVFMVPLPSILVDAITGSLKSQIANIVEGALFMVGYPIARSGVILSIGQYQLQVADACSGLHSMFSLSALGTVFMYLSGRKSPLHLGIMLASILPIAFLSNIVRVCILVLVTYYLGDEAGQGFLHGAAGMVLMIVALIALILLDMLLGRLLPSAPSGSKSLV